MKIAITSQNRRTVTAHAGRCRRFWVYQIEDGGIQGRELLELDKTATLHELAPGVPQALLGVDVLLSSGMCDNLVARLGRHGISAYQTSCEQPEQALQHYLEQHAAQPA
jgi:predicted Fe-Mo cluster-binding NifX family protein